MKILIVKPSSLGDVIHALPFLKAVKDSFPGARVDWVISKSLKGLLEDNPLIHELIVFDKDSWKEIKNLPGTISEIKGLRKILKSKRYDMVIDLQGLLRSGLITFLTPASMKVGFKQAREGSHYFYNLKIPGNGAVHAVDKCLEVATVIGAKSKKIEFPLFLDMKARERVARLIDNIPEYVVIAPSARWATKRWPAGNFSSLIKRISLPCIIAGSRGDSEIAREIIRGIQNTEQGTRTATTVNLCGRTSLKELVVLIDGAKAVVSNDSGPMHIAAALNKPLVAIFGPTDPAKTGPYGYQENRNMKVIRTSVPCSPCRKKRCRESVCMKDISVDTVFNALEEYL